MFFAHTSISSGQKSLVRCVRIAGFGTNLVSQILQMDNNGAECGSNGAEGKSASVSIVWESEKKSIRFVQRGDLIKVEGMSSSATFSIKEIIKKDLKGSWNFAEKFWALPLEFSLSDNTETLKVIGGIADEAHKKRMDEKAAEAAKAEAAKASAPKPCFSDFFGVPPQSVTSVVPFAVDIIVTT